MNERSLSQPIGRQKYNALVVEGNDQLIGTRGLEGRFGDRA